MEDKDLVDPVQEFRLESMAYFFHNSVLHGRIIRLLALLSGEAQVLRRHDALCSGVTGHDQNRVLKIHFPSLCVRDMAIVQHLKKDMEDIRVRFLDLIKKDQGIGTAAYFFAELTAFLVADVSGRRSDQLGDAVLLHIFRHVYADHRVFAPEEVLFYLHR